MTRYDTSASTDDDRNATTDRDYALARSRRRRVLRHLRRNATSTTVEALADAIERVDDDRREVLISLHHVDLPMLADAGLIEYDPERNRAEIVE